MKVKVTYTAIVDVPDDVNIEHLLNDGDILEQNGKLYQPDLVFSVGETEEEVREDHGDEFVDNMNCILNDDPDPNFTKDEREPFWWCGKENDMTGYIESVDHKIEKIKD